MIMCVLHFRKDHKKRLSWFSCTTADFIPLLQNFPLGRTHHHGCPTCKNCTRTVAKKYHPIWSTARSYIGHSSKNSIHSYCKWKSSRCCCTPGSIPRFYPRNSPYPHFFGTCFHRSRCTRSKEWDDEELDEGLDEEFCPHHGIHYQSKRRRAQCCWYIGSYWNRIYRFVWMFVFCMCYHPSNIDHYNLC